MNKQFSFGAIESKKDKRTIKHSSLAQVSIPLIKGGIDYLPQDIEHQHKEGICTAISLTQNRAKANGKKYSADFQYLLQKKFYDGNWNEGSSILNALKVGKKYGFLPVELWTYTTEEDRSLPYDQYINKLQQISLSEISRLILLCTDKIAGYADVDVKDNQAIAKAIVESNSGILCMYYTGDEWYTSLSGIISWNPNDIDPLRPPNPIRSGHAITMNKFNYLTGNNQTLSNTWGTDWNLKGTANINWDKYKMQEAWLITKNPVITKFNTNLSFGMSGQEVINLQNALKIKGYFNFTSTGYFGIITFLSVKKFQKDNKIINTGNCYQLTRACLNSLFNL